MLVVVYCAASRRGLQSAISPMCSYCCLLWEALGGRCAPPSASSSVCIYIPSQYWQSINASAERGTQRASTAGADKMSWFNEACFVFVGAPKEQSAHTQRQWAGSPIKIRPAKSQFTIALSAPQSNHRRGAILTSVRDVSRIFLRSSVIEGGWT